MKWTEKGGHESVADSQVSPGRRLFRRCINNRAVALSSDEGLLLELRELCAQPFEATYKKKLEAVALLLQRGDKRQIKHRAKAFPRTVQR